MSEPVEVVCVITGIGDESGSSCSEGCISWIGSGMIGTRCGNEGILKGIVVTIFKIVDEAWLMAILRIDSSITRLSVGRETRGLFVVWTGNAD